MHAGDLSKVNARSVNFADSGLRFANVEEGIFDEGIFTDIYAPFISGQKASFVKADLSRSNFFSADFQNADFSYATLRGVSFAFADLRGARFDGADLTGAYFLGAVLDNATFANASIENTEFTGAVAEKFLLSQKQKAGACRHDSYQGWHVSLFETGSNDSFAHMAVGFPNFTDRSLPRCTSKPLDMFYNTAVDNIQYAIFVERVSASKAGRKELFRKRMNAHVEFLGANLTLDRILKGDDVQRKSWNAFLNNAVKNTTPASKPYFNSDLMLIILLRAGVLDEKLFNWEELAEVHYDYEESVRKQVAGDFTSHSMWPPIFPPGVSWADLPQNKGEIYKAWTMARLDKAPGNVIFKGPLALGEGKTAGASLIVPLSSIPFGKKGDHYSGAEDRGIPIARTVYMPIEFSYAGINDSIQALYVFPDKLERFRLELPARFQEEKKLELELEFKIEKFERLQKPETSGRRGHVVAFVFVTPADFRLLKEGNVIWSGTVNIDKVAVESEAWNKIKNSVLAQDFRAFLAMFPNTDNAERARVKLEELAWHSIRICCDAAKLGTFLKEFPNGVNAHLARAKLSRLVKSTDPAPANLKPGVVRLARLRGGAEMCFVWIPPGSFLMGSPSTEKERQWTEGPQRQITVSEGFWIGQFEVTQGQYEAVTGANPSVEKRLHLRVVPTFPVVDVSWDEVKAFIDKLNQTNVTLTYRLPTEAEWEYATRAGNNSVFAFGDRLSSDQANFDGNYPYGGAALGPRLSDFTSVGSYSPNEWGLYDVHGNAQEWVEDIYNNGYDKSKTDGSANNIGEYPDSNMRVTRGGSFRDGGALVRSAARDKNMQTRSSNTTGFRLILKTKSTLQKP